MRSLWLGKSAMILLRRQLVAQAFQPVPAQAKAYGCQ